MTDVFNYVMDGHVKAGLKLSPAGITRVSSVQFSK